MDNNKQIEEMAKIVAEVQYLGGLEEKVAERLYTKGYRKASEVAEEIFGEIERMCIDTFGNFNHRVFADLKKKWTESCDG